MRIARAVGARRHGTLYPAIKRFETTGLLTREAQPGAAAAPKHVLGLTEAGEVALRQWLRGSRRNPRPLHPQAY
jgi:DNA-binding PadR family transcriptional regulator